MTETSNVIVHSNDSDPVADRHEAKVHAELNAQHRELMRQAQGTFEAIKGRLGARNEEYWQEAFCQAKIDYSSGQFLIQRLGADRQLDLPLVATLTQLRHELLVGIDNPTIADHMLADSAILAYRNMLRVQGWIGSTAFIVQRELFGQEPLATSHGYGEEMVIEKRVEQLEQSLMPLLDRAQRMMIRALDRLETRRSGKALASISITRAGQVNVGSSVLNDRS